MGCRWRWGAEFICMRWMQLILSSLETCRFFFLLLELSFVGLHSSGGGGGGVGGSTVGGWRGMGGGLEENTNTLYIHV